MIGLPKEKFILFLLESLDVGGVTSFVKQYAFAALDLGYIPLIIGSQENLSEISFFPEKCIVRTINCKGRYGLKNRIFNFFVFYNELRKVLKTYNIEIVHYSLTWPFIYSLFFFHFWKIKKISTFYGCYDLESDYGEENPSRVILKLKKTFKNFLRKKLQHLNLSFSDQIIVFGEYSRRLITEHFSKTLDKKILIIPGMIFSKPMEKNKNEFFKETKSPLSLLNFGRLERRKGIHILLEAVKLLEKRKVDVFLRLASPYDLYETARHFEIYQLLNLFNSVQFLHSADSDQKKWLLKNSDVFVFPSLDLETFGLTMLESLQAGVPVIGTPCCSIPEVLSKIDRRLIAKNISSEALAERVSWFSSLSSEEKYKLSKKCQEVVFKNYNYKNFTNIFSGLYQKP